MRRITLFIICALSLLSTTARPKIGLVLGGGGAKGAAEVGALKVIEEMGIPIDYIAGTSIGSIVGGLYAAGFRSDELDSLFCQQEWLSLLTGRREDLSGEIIKTVKGVTYIFGFPVIDRSNNSFGMLHGNKVEQMLDSMLATKNQVEFDTLPIPFRCVAAELRTASEVVLSEGILPHAMRASMAIPGLFKPVEIGGRKLIDGGMMNNLPVDVVRDMGADIVIAIDLQQAEPNKRKQQNINDLGFGGISTFLDLLGIGQLANWIVNRPDVTKYLENRANADILIRPALPDYEASSFSKEAVRRMIKIGEQAAREQIQKLQELREISVVQ